MSELDQGQQADPATRFTAALESVASVLGDPGAIERLTVTGPSEVLPSTFAVTAAASAAVAAATLSVAEIVRPAAAVGVDTGHAAAMMRSERHLRIGAGDAPALWDQVAGDYETADGWIRLHTNYPHHRRAAMGVLATAEDRSAVAAAVRTWSGAALEAAIVDAGGCAATMRSLDEWNAHPHGQHVPDRPVVAIARVAAGPAEPLDAMEDVRILDLTRVIAGPMASRFLAGWGAAVLRVDVPGFRDAATLVVDTGFGKRSCALDLKRDADRQAFEALVAGADVVVHGFRPGALAALGYDTDVLLSLRPGVVVASESAYGPGGPWAGRRGFDSLVQMSSGIAAEGARAAGADRPVPLPCQLLDHATGLLLAAGIATALRRRRDEGGGFTVEASLARTAAWLDALGRVDSLGVPEPTEDDVQRWCADMVTPWGQVRYVRPAGTIDGVTPSWRRPPSRPGTDPPTWAE